ncbi:MAG: hydrolase [Gammaproteobacteria bacterium]|nr:hydrolase [Gammaproteobacteria bacterium]MCI0590013.1 hydrolase [Gammaproteobacteria bacterium]
MIIRQPFKPAWWLPGPHAQTLWPRLPSRAHRIALQQERLELPDGDFVDLAWTTGRSGPIVIVLHGLEGGIRSPYVARVMAAIHERKWRGVLLHFRGCGSTLNRLARSYHSGDTGDISYLIDILREREPITPLACVGYSLGGNVLLKYLGERGSDSGLTAAVAVSVPFDLHNSAERLDRGFSRFYQWILLKSLRAKTTRKFRMLKSPIALDRLATYRNFHAFDDAITAPLHGFKNVDDYYNRSSSRQYLSRICVPTLILHAADDPFMTREAIPDASALSPSTSLELSEHGGHVGFVSGPVPWRARYWLDERIPRHLAAYIGGIQRP